MWLWRVALVGALGAGIVGCGDKDGDSGPAESTDVNNPCDPDFVVVAGGEQTCGETCPEGSTLAYTDGHYMACDECEVDGEQSTCDEGETCSTQCGPGCENDTAKGCCPIRVCE